MPQEDLQILRVPKGTLRVRAHPQAPAGTKDEGPEHLRALRVPRQSPAQEDVRLDLGRRQAEEQGVRVFWRTVVPVIASCLCTNGL